MKRWKGEGRGARGEERREKQWRAGHALYNLEGASAFAKAMADKLAGRVRATNEKGTPYVSAKRTGLVLLQNAPVSD